MQQSLLIYLRFAPSTNKQNLTVLVEPRLPTDARRRQQFLHHVLWPALQDALITASAICAMTAAAITLAEGLPQRATRCPILHTGEQKTPSQNLHLKISYCVNVLTQLPHIRFWRWRLEQTRLSQDPQMFLLQKSASTCTDIDLMYSSLSFRSPTAYFRSFVFQVLIFILNQCICYYQ